MNAIVAVYSDWGIGKDGTQPLVIPDDRRHFREVTGTGALIVGRRTLEDFPGQKPLKNRLNIVLSRHNINIEGALVAHSPGEAAELAQNEPSVFVVGGGSVYDAMLPFVDRVYVTKIDAGPESDTFFKNLDADPAWQIVSDGAEAEHDGVRYRYMIYERV